jgi:hypothetical protein
MATNNSGNFGTGTIGQVLTSNGPGVSPTFQTSSGGITVTQFDAVSGGAGNTLVSFGPGNAGQVYQSSGAGVNPAYSTATYPSTTTINQLLYSSATNVISGLSTSNNGVLITSATGVPSILSTPTVPGVPLNYNGTSIGFFNPLQQSYLFEDFIAGYISANSFGRWTNSVVNGGNLNLDAVDNAHPGIAQLQTGTSANGISYLIAGGPGNGIGQILLGGGVIDIYWVIQIPVLSNGTDRFNVSIGLGDQKNTGGFDYYNNGCCFDYSDNVNSGNWRLSTMAGGTVTHVNSSTLVGTTFTTLRININASATLVTFYVNGVSVGTSSTNIPTLGCSPFATFEKRLGTTSRNLNLDMYYHFINLTSAR